jgi:hypothetical protein
MRTSRVRPLSQLPLRLLSVLTVMGGSVFGGGACSGEYKPGKTTKDTGSQSSGPVDADDDGFPEDEDCDDLDGTAYPGADELCDGRDNDCDEEIDEDDAVDPATWYADADGDGYGDPNSITEACDPVSGTVDNDEDCDDTDATLNPDTVWYRDRDADGFGDDETAQQSCIGAESSIRDGGDCDDRDATVFPGADEVCNGVDDDCDGVVDPNTALDAEVWYADADSDGYGDATTTQIACELPAGHIDDDRDCDDGDADVHPGADEICNGYDDDCDGSVDESGAIDATLWYADLDGDGYGDPAASTLACDAPSDTSSDNTDCDDSDPATWPGATEYCDGHDDDCDGDIDESDAADVTTWYGDADADGYGATASGSTDACDAPSGYAATNTDCDDGDDHVYPGAAELCDGVDTDCDSSTGEDGLVGYNASTGWQDVSAYFTGTRSSPAGVTVLSDGELWFCAGTWYTALYLEADVDVIGSGGTTSVVLDAAGDAPVVTIETGGVTASISGMTLTGGVGGTATSGLYAGGGVHCETSGDLALSDLVITDNSATEGGGVKSDGCDVTMDDVEISDNNATYGGGFSIYDGTAELVDSEIVDNVASTWGGGIEIWADAGNVSVDLDGTRVHGNDGGSAGGGILMYEAPYSVSVLCDGSRSSAAGIYDNTANYGGGVFVYSGTLTATSCDTGSGSTDNDPDDVGGNPGSSSYGNNASFVCTASTCTP